MFAMYDYDRKSGKHGLTGVVPTFPVRVGVLALTVASELDALGYYAPNETPMHLMYELVDMAVARHFPGMDDFGGNDVYVRKMVRCVGKRAFAHLDAGNVVSPEMSDSTLVTGSTV